MAEALLCLGLCGSNICVTARADTDTFTRFSSFENSCPAPLHGALTLSCLGKSHPSKVLKHGVLMPILADGIHSLSAVRLSVSCSVIRAG